jgi:hypothetical protein
MFKITTASVIVASLMLCASSVLAGPLASDPNGMPGFTGSAAFSSGDLAATLDYAVFAPGDFTGNSPFKGTEYIYAYQVFDTGNTSVTSFSVGLLTDHGAHDITADPAYAMTGGVAPAPGAYLLSNSAIAYFTNPALAAGTGYSQVVLFASPNGPTYASASVGAPGISDQNMAPTPTPEPASLALLSILGFGLSRRRPR